MDKGSIIMKFGGDKTDFVNNRCSIGLNIDVWEKHVDNIGALSRCQYAHA